MKTPTAKRPAAPRPPVRRPRRPTPAAPPEAAEVSPRIARRERRRERSREEILEAARRVLLREGIAATTLEAVAREVGLTKAALYYYYPSKDALLFEIMYGVFEAQARAIHGAVGQAGGGAAALRAIIRETVQLFAPRMDDFRLAFLHAQVASPGALSMGAAQLARIRPLNELAYAGATRLLTEERHQPPVREPTGRQARPVEPRLMAFLASASALGLLTMKGLVESLGDPLLYSDEQLIEGMARIFEAATGA